MFDKYRNIFSFKKKRKKKLCFVNQKKMYDFFFIKITKRAFVFENRCGYQKNVAFFLMEIIYVKLKFILNLIKPDCFKQTLQKQISLCHANCMFSIL